MTQQGELAVERNQMQGVYPVTGSLWPATKRHTQKAKSLFNELLSSTRFSPIAELEELNVDLDETPRTSVPPGD